MTTTATGRSAALALLFAALAVAIGLLRAEIWRSPVLVSFDLAAIDLPVTPMGGGLWSVDLSALHIADQSDDRKHPERSRLVLLQDGITLTPHAAPDTLTAGAGRYRHTGNALILATADGRSPLDDGHRYQIAVELPGDVAVGVDPTVESMPWPSGEQVWLVVLAALGATMLGVAFALAKAARELDPQSRRAIAAASFLAALAGLSVDAGAHWRDLAAGNDTLGYTVTPGRTSYRMPGYWLFGHAVVGHEWQPDLAKPLPGEAYAPPSQAENPLIRVTQVQKLLAVAAALLFGLAFICVLPAPVAAAIALLVGNLTLAGTWADHFGGIIVTLACIACIVRTVLRWRAGQRDRRVLAAEAVAMIAGTGAFVALLQFGLMADYADWLLSEGIATPLQVMALAAIVGFVYSRRDWLLPVAAAAMGLHYMARPSDLAGWVVIAGLGALLVRRRGWRAATLPCAAAAACFAALVLAPSLWQASVSIVPTVPERHALAFASLIAEPSDRVLMTDPQELAYFDAISAKLAASRAADPDFCRPLYRCFVDFAYNVAWPAVVDAAGETGKKGQTAGARALARRIATTILTAAPGRYLALVSIGIPDTISSVRVFHAVPLWLALALLLVGAWAMPGDTRWPVLLLGAAASVAAITPLMASIPISRLIAPADGYLLTAFILLWARPDAPRTWIARLVPA